jgi:hypothetical protein
MCGIAMLGAGLLVQGILTRLLFVRESAIDPERLPRFGDLFFQLPGNLNALGAWIDYRANLALAVIVTLVVLCAWRRVREIVPLGLLVSSMLATTLMFARATETRVWFQFLPIVLLCAAYILRGPADSPKAEPVTASLPIHSP